MSLTSLQNHFVNYALVKHIRCPQVRSLGEMKSEIKCDIIAAACEKDTYFKDTYFNGRMVDPYDN